MAIKGNTLQFTLSAGLSPNRYPLLVAHCARHVAAFFCCANTQPVLMYEAIDIQIPFFDHFIALMGHKTFSSL